MGVLDQVMQLRGQGLGEEEIISNLQQQGTSPKEITDAINQANIKSAVTDQGTGEAPTPGEAPAAGGSEGFYSPQTQEAGAAQMPGQSPEYYEEGAYAGGEAPAAGMDSDTMIEIANQVFSEKIKKIQNQIEETIEFKTIAQTKIENINERLKKIEKMIDNLQIKILEKVSSFGSDIRNTKKEVAMVENTLEKVMKGKTHKKAKKTVSRKKK